MLSRRHLTLAALLPLILSSGFSQSSKKSWAGNGNSDFGNSNNWKDASGNATVPPGQADVAAFDSAATSQPAITSSQTVAGIEISDAAGNVTLTGNATLTVGNSGLANNSSANAQSVATPLVFTGDSSSITNQGNLTISAPVTNNTNNGLALGGNGNNGNINGSIDGGGDLIKTDSGTWNLNAANGYAGQTKVQGGTLRAGAAGALPNGKDVTVAPHGNSSATLDLTGTTEEIGNLTLGGDAGTTAAIALNSGNLTLGGDVVYDATNAPGAANISGGTIGLGGNRTFKVDKGANTSTGDLNISSAITGPGADLVKQGAGKLVLSGNNSYTGATIVDDGRLQIAAGGTHPSGGAVTVDEQTTGGNAAFDLGGTSQTVGTLTLRGAANSTNLVDLGPGGNLTLGGDVVYDAKNQPGQGRIWNGNAVQLGAAQTNFTVDHSANAPMGDLSVETPLTGAGGLAKGGSGTLVLAADNTYAGQTVVNNGTLQVGNGANHGAVAGDIANNAQLVFKRNDATTYGHVISGNGTLLVDGNGTGVLTLAGTNTYSGSTTVQNGTLAISSEANLGGTLAAPNASAVVLNGGTLEITGNSAVGFGANRGVSLINSGGTIQADAGATLSVAGGISGNSNLTKTGAGTLELHGSNSLSGQTQVQAGTLKDGAANAFSPASAIAVATGATLSVNNNESIGGLNDLSGGGGAVTLAKGANLALNNNGQFSGAITGDGSLELASTSTANQTLTGTNTYTGGTKIGQGTMLQIGSGTDKVGGTTGSIASGNINNNGSLVFARSDAIHYGGISGNGMVTQNGAGTLTLDGGNTYTGGTHIQSGTVTDSTAGALPNGGDVFLSGGTLAVAHDETIGALEDSGSNASAVAIGNGAKLTLSNRGSAYSGSITGGGALQVTNGAYETLTGNATHTGGTTIGAGANLQIGQGGANGAVAGSITNNGRLSFNRSDTITYSGITGAGEVEQLGSGTLTLAGTNSYTGQTTVNSGTLADGNAGAFAPGSVIRLYNASTLNVNAAESIAGLGGSSYGGNSVVNLNGALTISAGDSYTGGIAGNGSLTIATGAHQTLAGSIGHTGGTSIANGASLQIGNGSSANSVAGDISNNGSLTFSPAATLAYGGKVSGSGSLNVNNSSGTVSLTGQSTYTGSTFIGSGTLQVAATNALPTTTRVNMANGRLDVASDQTIAQLNGQNTSAVSLSGHTLTIAPQAAGKNSHLDGAITGSGTLVYNGAAGTSLALTNGGSSYSGGTQIAGGSVYVGAGGALGTGQVSVANGAALLVGNSDSSDVTLSNAVTLAGGATVGGDSNEDALVLSGSVALPSAATVHLQNGVKFSGNLHAASGTSAVTFDSANGQFARGVLLGTIDPSVTSITASNAGVIFGSQAAVPTSGLNVSASNGYVGIGAAGGYTTPSAASVLNLIGNKGSFGGTIGFDSANGYGAPHVFSDAVDLSGFGSGTTLGSSTSAVLNGTITPGANGYAFGNGGGVLVVQSALGGTHGVNVSSTSSMPGNSLTAVFQGANAFAGPMAVTNSVAVLDSAAALPSGDTVTLGDNGYIGVTEAYAGAKNFGDFVAHQVAPGGYTSTSIIGIDSHAYIANAVSTGSASGARTVSDAIDLSSLGAVYLGTATGLVLGGPIKAPTQNGANKTLSLLAADDATLTVSSALTADNVGSVVVGSGAAFANGTVSLAGFNTYTGGTTLRSGTLQLQQGSYKSHGSIVAGPLGTGTLTVNPAGQKTPVLAANGYVALDNSVALAGTLQLGTPNSGYYTDTATTTTRTSALSSLSYGELILNGVISDASVGAQGALVIAGPTELNGANTFSGGTTVQSDQLGLGNDAGLGTGTVTISSTDGRVDIYSYNGARTLANALVISGSSQTVYFGGNFTLNGSLALNAPLAVSTETPDVLHINGPLSGNGLFTAEYGTVLLTPSAATTATGGFLADNGTLIFGNANALPAQPTYNALTANYDGYIGIGYVPTDLQNSFINRFNKGATQGAIGFDSLSAGSPNTFNTPIDLTGFQSTARLGSATAAILGSGATITPQASTYNFGNGGGLLQVDAALTDAPTNATYPGSRDVNVQSSYDAPLTLRLTGANTYSGGTTVNNSGVVFGAGALPAQGTITGEEAYVGTEDPALIADPNTFISRFDPDVYSMIVGFDATNGGSVTVAHDISLTGFTDDVFLGTSTNALLAGNITLPAGQSSYNFAAYKGGQLTVATDLGGANSVTIGQDYNPATFGNPTVAGAPLSRVTLTGANSYTGGTYLNAGELFVGNEHALGTGTLNVNGNTSSDGRHVGFSTTTNGITLANPIALTWAQFDVGGGDATFGLSGAITGQSGSGLYKVGGGTLTLSGDNSGFAGDVVIQGGSVVFAPVASGNSFGTGSLSFDSTSPVSATFQDNATVNGLEDFNGTGTINLTSGKTFAINQSSDSEFGGTIAGSTAGLTLTGGGYQLVLSGANTYVGATTVQGNVSVVARSSSAFGAATNAVTLNGGSIVLEPGVTMSNPLSVTAGRLAGTGTFGASNVTVGTNALVTPGLTEAIGTLQFANSLTFASGGTLQLRLSDVGATSGGWDQVQVGGTLAITATAGAPFTLQVVPFTAGGLLSSTLPANFNPYAAGSWLVVSANSITGFDANQFTIDSSAFSSGLAGGTFSLAMNATNNGLMLNFTPVPEPSTYALMLAGLGTVFFVSRRKRKTLKS